MRQNAIRYGQFSLLLKNLGGRLLYVALSVTQHLPLWLRKLFRIHSKYCLFDPTFYLSYYPDVARAGVDPLYHFLTYGRSEGRLGTPPKLNCSTDGPKFDPCRDTVLVVSHNATRTGAPILCLNIVQELGKRYNVIVLLLDGGAIENSFYSSANIVVNLPGSLRDNSLISFVINGLLSEHKIKFALVNSVESRQVLPPLSKQFIPTVCLIHEFASYTRPRYGVTESIFWANKAVFSANITLDSAVLEYPDLAREDQIVLVQGRSYPPVIKETKSVAELEATKIARVFRPEDWPKDTVVIIGLGTVQIRKGVDLFISCAARVLQLVKNKFCRFVWIGNGYNPEHDNGYSVYLADQVVRSGLEKHVFFLDEISNIDLAYKQANILLLSSRLDPMPNVAIDAMFHKLPLVCFANTTGIADIISADAIRSECLAPYLDVEALASRVSSLVDSQELRSRVGNRLFEVASRIFNMEDYVTRLENIALLQAAPSSQEQLDCQDIVNSGVICQDYIVPPEADVHTDDEMVRLFVRSWASGIWRRKPFAGFHPGIYTECCKQMLDGANPLAHFLRSGKPEGPWNFDVISPEENNNTLKISNRIALHIHIFYADLAYEIFERLKNNRFRPDLFISVPSQEVSEQIKKLICEYSGLIADFKIVPNRGRNIAPLLTAFGHRLTEQYEIVGHLHTKKTVDIVDPNFGQRWFSFLLDNLLGKSHKMMDTILFRMANNPTIGLVFPDDPYVLSWGKNKEYALSIAEKLKIDGSLRAQFNFPVGNMFWARSSAIRPLVELNLRLQDYPPEPLQHDGSILHAIERLLPFLTDKAGLKVAVTYVPGSTR